MGLLDLLKKKPVTFKTVENPKPSYNPWDKSKGNSNKDYATANFLHMLSFQANPIKAKADDYPRYVSYELKINDPIKKHKELLKAGYLRESTAAEVLGTFKVADLKAILEANGIPPKGKKAELIQAAANLDPAALKLPVMYCVSEKGLDFIKQNEDFIKLHLNPYEISFEEFITAKSNAHPHFKFNDIIWFIFNQREMSFPVDAYGLKRNNRLHMAMFLKSENRLKDSLYHYIEVLYYDINNPSFDVIAPKIKEAIYELKDHYTDEMVSKCYSRIYLPNKIPQESFMFILNGIFQEEK